MKRCAPVPSAFARYKSAPLMNTRRLPSRDQAPELPSTSPSRRGEPAGNGSAHKGTTLSPVDIELPTSSWEWSGEMSWIFMLLTGAEIVDVSPPVAETCASTVPSGRHWVV